VALEKTVSQDIREKINATLAPYLSLRNFQVSVAARLNADQKQTNETTYDPDSRVERSVRVVKEHQASQNAAGQQPASVAANLPKAQASSSDSKQSSDDNLKREELTNFEILSKSVVTTSAGFTVEGLSVAVLINRSALVASLGDKPATEAVDKQVKEIEALVASAAGLRKERGDSVKISIVDFVDSAHDLEPVAGPSFVELALRQSGSLVNAGAGIGVAAMAIWFVIRPATRALLTAPPLATQASPALAAIRAGARPAEATRDRRARCELSDRGQRRARRISRSARGAQGQEPATSSPAACGFRRGTRRGDTQTMDSPGGKRMKPVPISHYLNHIGHGAAADRPPPPREDAPLRSRPTLAVSSTQARGPAPLFRTLSELSRGARPPDAAKFDAAPAQNLGARIEEVYARGVQDGAASTRAELAQTRAEEIAADQERILIERLDFHLNEYAELANVIGARFVEIEDNIGACFARMLQPLLEKSAARQVIEELAENIRRLCAGASPGLMRIRGPERLLHLLRERIGALSCAIDYIAGDEVEVLVEAGDTLIESQLGP
jgi:limonene-1,2-epoxide hydrolase